MLLTKADKWLVAILLVAALGGIALNVKMMTAAGEQAAYVYKEGRLVQILKLRAGYTEQLRLGGSEHFNLIVAENGRIRIAEADCPDQICVRTGWVSLAPQQIVCLPYRVVVRVQSETPADVDDITR